MSTELSQGESEDISAPLSLELLAYVGSASESSSKPMYGLALDNTALPEISHVQVGSASTILQNSYFTLNSSGNFRKYYAWFNKDGLGTDPTPAGIAHSIQVPITTGQTAAQVATALMTQLNLTANGDFVASILSGFTDTVVLSNASAGVSVAPANFDTTFTVTSIQSGVGIGNYVIQDGDNLTLGIKKLDQAVSAFITALDDPSYDELIDIVASGGVAPLSLNGPVPALTIIDLPLNSRLGNAVQNYTVGKGTIQFDLNGQRLALGRDWAEVGSPGNPSHQIQILRQLEVFDLLQCEIIVWGGIGSGGGGIGPTGPAGPQGPQGLPAATGPVTYSIKTANYSVLSTDCFLLADSTGGAVAFTLPPASSNGGRIFYFKKLDSSGNPMNIVTSGIDLIDGMSSLSTSTQYQAFSLISIGSGWSIF